LHPAQPTTEVKLDPKHVHRTTPSRFFFEVNSFTQDESRRILAIKMNNVFPYNSVSFTSKKPPFVSSSKGKWKLQNGRNVKPTNNQ
jgi:hypothetical protein